MNYYADFHFEAFSEVLHFLFMCTDFVIFGFVGIELHPQCPNLKHVHCLELQSMALQQGGL
jgi:hypothetical protein